jgi:excisionase family DNA binding protein
MSSKTDLLSIPQCAKILRTTRQAIGQAIKNGRIVALRFGHVKLIPRISLEAYKRTRHPGGRPAKKQGQRRN